jgi:hypothetical protein
VLEPAQLAALALDRRQRLLERALERARDQPVLGLARVELAARALGLVLGARSTASRCPASRCSCWSCSSPIARAVAPMPAGVTASRNASATAMSSRPPPSDWHARPVAWSTWPRTHA